MGKKVTITCDNCGKDLTDWSRSFLKLDRPNVDFQAEEYYCDVHCLFYKYFDRLMKPSEVSENSRTAGIHFLHPVTHGLPVSTHWMTDGRPTTIIGDGKSEIHLIGWWVMNETEISSNMDSYFGGYGKFKVKA